MPAREKVIRFIEEEISFCESINQDYRTIGLSALRDILVLLKEQESIKPTINEYGEAYCVCGENVGIIPSDKSLPKIRSNYCPGCGKRMKWEDEMSMSETRPKRKVEFIESYWTGGEFGSDYQWNDNHGELVRCKDCRWYDEKISFCDNCHLLREKTFFCADGKRKEGNK